MLLRAESIDLLMRAFSHSTGSGCAWVNARQTSSRRAMLMTRSVLEGHGHLQDGHQTPIVAPAIQAQNRMIELQSMRSADVTAADPFGA